MAFAAVPVVASSSTTTVKGVKRRNERNILTFYEKIAVIRYYEDTNISRNSLAKMFHCCATQIRRILEKKQELLQQLATLSEADASLIIEEMTRKRRKFEMSAISFILHKWVERCRLLRLRKSITNQTLKETALKMATLLNLPAFRPSYRWLNRFRGKYRYNAEDLGVGAIDGVLGELSVEDIIIEYKDSLPSFMQKEISAITSSAKVGAAAGELEKESMARSEDDEGNEDEDDDDDIVEVPPSGRGAPATTWEADLDNGHSLSSSSDEATMDLKETKVTKTTTTTTTTTSPPPLNGSNLNAGSSALLTSIFPHLAVIHQFALLNSDVKALELISQLGVHMQAQAESGSYKQLSMSLSQIPFPGDEDAIYPDIDDIVLME